MNNYQAKNQSTANTKYNQLKKGFQALVGAATFVSCSLAISTSASAVSLVNGSSNPTDFHTDGYVNTLQQFVNEERTQFDVNQFVQDTGARELVPNTFYFTEDTDVNVYFLNEGAYFNNQLGVTYRPGGNQEIIWNNIACSQGDCELNSSQAADSNSAIKIGDYSNLGVIEGGAGIEFFLTQNGYNDINGQTLPSTQNAKAFGYDDYVVLVWEDVTFGGDNDFNDVVLAFNAGEKNIGNIAGTPEPLTIAGSLLAGVTGLLLKKKSGSKSNNI